MLSRVWAACLVLLIAATWRLWLPGNVLSNNAYPSVAMLAITPSVSWWLATLSLVGVYFACFVAVTFPTQSSVAWGVISCCLVVSFVVDQHRLQPWAYQAAIAGVLFAALDERPARRCLIWFLASTYIYSALGKLDYQFIHTVGQDFLRPPLSCLGLEGRVGEKQKIALAIALPLIELAGGVGVLFQSTRQVAGWLIMAMHIGLFVMLGPLGFNHSYGVLLWNLLLAYVAWELFVRWYPQDSSPRNPISTHSVSMIAYALLGLVVVLPLAERWGYFDHWPSWALYSPHNSRVKVQVHASAVQSLPSSLQEILAESHASSGWIDIDLDQWSLDQRGVPIYPQSRYQLSIVAHLAATYQLDDAMRCVVQGVSDRWTGRRVEKVAIGETEIRRLLQPFWLVSQ